MKRGVSGGPAPHVFELDPDLPHPDHRGRRVCRACHLLGRAGDAHHTVPDTPEQAVHRHRVDVHDD